MPRLIDTVRAVGFDLDGTLIDTAPDLTIAVNVTLMMLGGTTLEESRIRSLIGNGVDQLVLRALSESLGSPPELALRLSAAQSLFGRLYRQRLFDRSSLYPGALAALRALADAGRTLCCITNKADTFAGPLLSAAQIRELFAFTLSPDRDEDRKPGPNLLLAACSRLGISPPEMLYVGDSRTDIVAAHAAGCRIVAVSYGYNHGLPLEALKPDAVVSSLTELLDLYVRPLFGRGRTVLHGVGAEA